MNTSSQDINVFDLDNETILQISRFVRLTRVKGICSLELSDPEVLKKMFLIASRNDDVELRKLFSAIRRSIKTKLHLVSDKSSHRPYSTMANESALVESKSPRMASNL